MYVRVSQWNEIKLLLSLFFGGGIWGEVLRVKKCCLTMHSSLWTLSGMVLYWENSIDSAPCSPRRPNPTRILLAIVMYGLESRRCILMGVVAFGNAFLKLSIKLVWLWLYWKQVAIFSNWTLFLTMHPSALWAYHWKGTVCFLETLILPAWWPCQ